MIVLAIQLLAKAKEGCRTNRRFALNLIGQDQAHDVTSDPLLNIRKQSGIFKSGGRVSAFAFSGKCNASVKLGNRGILFNNKKHEPTRKNFMGNDFYWRNSLFIP